MLALALCTVLLVLGYFTYGKLVERIFGPLPDRPTPALAQPDGVDTLPLPTWRVFLIQLLDIAGIGPIFGPILGALYGPVALVWIVVGALFAGGVHDYFSGMLSVRHGGASLPEVVGQSMGNAARHLLRVFSVLLLVLVGVVFTQSPAAMIGEVTGLPVPWLVAAIFAYYFLATVLPIDKIIGRLYLLFGGLLVFMTFAVLASFVVNELSDPATCSTYLPPAWKHPGGLPVWPLLFITLSCGAISGFHSTQSPIMARCIQSERFGRRVFYGAMVFEGFIALIWASVGMMFYPSADALHAVIAKGTPALVVSQACHELLGPIGGLVAIFGVIILPITSGDTAFRSTRMILAEPLNLDQRPILNRLAVAIPLFAVAAYVSTIDFQLVWRYFGWSNQALSSLVLWTAAAWLARNRKFHWIASLPAAFMTAIVVAFILQAKIGFGLPPRFANPAGVVLALAALAAFLRAVRAPSSAAAETDGPP
jgi:carbon starvation protein CstA